MNSERNILEENAVLESITLSQLVTKDYRTAAVFEKHNLDFCCRGNKPITEACSEKGVDLAEVLKDLDELQKNKSGIDLKYHEWDLDFLVDYIINNHHKYVVNMIPIISAHTEKVAKVHGKNHPEVIEVNSIFTMIYKDLRQHLLKEEQILFPFIKQLVKDQKNETKPEQPYFGTIANPIRMMESEHEAAGDGFYEIRKLTKNYTLPEDACNTFMASYNELKEFEEDLHKHVHLENNILFPRAIELEVKLNSI